MHTGRSLVATLLATAGLSSFAVGAVGAVQADDSTVAPPTTPPTAPVPPTCTCPPPPSTLSPVSSVPVAVTTAAVAAPVTTVAVAPATVGVAPVAGATIPANATLEQLQQGIEPMFGPTTDVMAEFAIFGVTPPQGVPTPTGAAIEEFSFELLDLADPETASYYGAVIVSSDATAADLVTLYQSALPAAGFTQTGDSVEDTDSGQIRWLEFDLPNSDHFIAELEVGIFDRDVDHVQIRWRDGVDPALGAMFTAWTGLPLVDQAQLIEDATIGNWIFGDLVQVQTDYRVGIEHAQLESQFLAGLAGTPYTVDVEASEPGRWSTLDGGPFADLTVHFGEGYVEGTSALNVGAQYER